MSAAAPFQEATPSAPKADQVTQPQLQGSDQEEPPSYEACVSQFNHEPTGRVDINISMKKTPRSKAKITKLVASVVVKLLGSKFEFPETNQQHHSFEPVHIAISERNKNCCVACFGII